MTKLETIRPTAAAELASRGHAVIVDIREPDDFRQARIAGAVSHPLSRLTDAPLPVKAGQAPVFACKSGMRTAANRERLEALCDGAGYILEGGLEAWTAAGLPVAG